MRVESYKTDINFRSGIMKRSWNRLFAEKIGSIVA